MLFRKQLNDLLIILILKFKKIKFYKKISNIKKNMILSFDRY